MNQNKAMRYKAVFTLLICLSIELRGTCQTANPTNVQADVQESPRFDIPDVSTKVGDALPSTGMEQMSPQVMLPPYAVNSLMAEADRLVELSATNAFGITTGI